MTTNKVNFWMVGFFCILGVFIGVVATYFVLKYLPEKNGATVPEEKKISLNLDGYGTIGSESAKATIVEFSDYQCPACGAFYEQIFPALKTKYIDTGKVRFVSKDFPLFSIHPYAEKAAEASHCALEQGKFWEMHGSLYGNQSAWSASKDSAKAFTGLAADLGLDAKNFKDCLDSKKHQQAVIDSLKEGAAAEVEGTPTFFINNKLTFFGAYPIESFDKALAAEGVE
ncbi:DsbA family protein [Candidatus Peregrinibacteria bacterium]|nr:DsbA family protein [Candidatus Peregrinibacteria bacterium]